MHFLIYVLMLLSVQSINCSALTLRGGGVSETVYGFPDVLASYSLANPAINFQISTNSGPTNREGVEKGTLDFGLSSGPMLLSESINYPNITFLPIVATAIVPVFRLDSINQTLTFSLSTLAYIYAGQLTNWNDTRIQNDNPNVMLPNQSITVVSYGEPRYITDIWIRALVRARPETQSILPTPSSGLSWPFSSYSNWLTAIGITGTAAMVVDTDGSIGYCIQAAAVTTGAKTAKLINIYGSPVVPNTLSVSYAVSERSLQNIPNRLIQVPDLTGCTSMACWPIVEPIFVVVDQFIAPRGCTVKKQLIDFLNFYYSSTKLTKKLLAAYQMVNIPPEVQESLDVPAELAKITCYGDSFDSQSTNQSTSVMIGTPELMHEFLEAESDFYQLVDQSFSFDIQPYSPADGVQSIQLGSTSANFYYPGEIAAYQSITGNSIFVDHTNFLHLPMFLTSIALVYNPTLAVLNHQSIIYNTTSQLNQTINQSINYNVTSAPQLTISADLIAQVMLGDITSWNDSKWLGYNPFLSSILIDQSIDQSINQSINSIPVKFVIGCLRDVAQAPMSARLFDWIQNHIVDQSISQRFQHSFSPMSNSSTAQLFWRCQRSSLLPTLIYSAKETSHQQLINSRPGSFSFIRDNLDAQSNKFSMMFDGNKRQSSSRTMKDCVNDQANADMLSFNVESAALKNATCWPLTRVLTVQIAKDFGSNDLLAWRTLSWLNTIVNSSSADYWSDNLMVIRVAQHPSMKILLTEALYSVIVDGETVLITHPIIWKLNEAIFWFGTIFVALIGLLTIGSVIFFVLFRNFKIIRSNSPMFMCISLTGIMLLLACIQLLVAPPSDATCGAVNWMANLGFQVTFMPLFAKAWRIYRIFGGRKLQVVKINNRKLAILVAIGLSLETLFLIIWQAVAPPTALTVIQYENNREHHYVQCGYRDSSMDFFLTSVIIKLFLVLFGVRMAFGTRQVSQEFSESKSIAVAIYNLIVAVGLISALVVLMDTVGDTLILLLVFCAIWVSLVTLFILVGPRVLAFLDSQRPRGSDAQFMTSQRSSLSGEYSFLSLNVLSNLQAAMTYMQSLETHLGDVRAKVGQLRGHLTIEGSTKIGSKLITSPKPSRSTNPLNAKVISNGNTTPSDARRSSLQNRLAVNRPSIMTGGSVTPLANTAPLSPEAITKSISEKISEKIGEKQSPTNSNTAVITTTTETKPPSSPNPSHAPRFSHSVQMSNVNKNPTSMSKGSWI